MDDKSLRRAWHESGMSITTAHPPSDTGDPEEWPDLFAAFGRAIRAEVVRELCRAARDLNEADLYGDTEWACPEDAFKQWLRARAAEIEKGET